MLRDFAISLWSHGALTGKPLIDPAIHLKRFRRSCIWLGATRVRCSHMFRTRRCVIYH